MPSPSMTSLHVDLNEAAKCVDIPCVPLVIKAIMISFKVSELDLIALKRNSVKIFNNTIMIVLIAKGTQGLYYSHC